MKKHRIAIALGNMVACTVGTGQALDSTNSFDPGGRAMGLGGSIYTAGADTFSCYYNPAGIGQLDSLNLNVALRNLPPSHVLFSQNFYYPNYMLNTRQGQYTITHAGVVIPLKNSQGKHLGSIGASYTLGGYLRNFRTAIPGNTLQAGVLAVQGFEDEFNFRNDFINICYGKHFEDKGISAGIGLVCASNSITSCQQYIQLDPAATPVNSVADSIQCGGCGFGGIVGLQYSPPENSSYSIGLSYRSPISLCRSRLGNSLYNQIPSRISAGFVKRTEKLRRERDYLLFGVQGDLYFCYGSHNILRQHPQVTGGIGAEYGLYQWKSYFPLRLGLNIVPPSNCIGATPGLIGLLNRHAITFGIGYKPIRGSIGVDLNFCIPFSGNNLDFSLNASVKAPN